MYINRFDILSAQSSIYVSFCAPYKKRIHQAVEKMVESLDLAAGSTTGFNIYAVVESYFTDLEKRKEINQLLNLEQDVCEEIEAELSYK